MTQKDTGGPAFPKAASDYNKAMDGMALRDYFAGQALLMLPHMGNGAELEPFELAHDAYRMADAMIAARKQA